MSGIISLRNVCWRTPGNSPVEIIKNISLDISPHEFIKICGPPSSGKTKLLEIIAGKTKITSGDIFYLDHTQESIKRQIKKTSFISEEQLFVYDRDLFYNIGYILRMHGTPKNIIEDKSKHVLKVTGLIGRAGIRVGGLSSTEKKLLSIAIAMAKEAEIILGDFNIKSRNQDEEIVKLLSNAAIKGAAVIVTATEDNDINVQDMKTVRLTNGEIK